MALSYSEALAFLYPRTTTIKFGLDTTRSLLAHLGDPQSTFQVVHIGGTNGKGSVAALVASALRRAGWRVGLYTSPHLCSFRERVLVDGVPISRAAVAMWTGRLRAVMMDLGATFFEATTAMAFADCAARRADLVVAEVGLGGRLDSTNVVVPLVSGITHIARDHMKYLGDSLEDIAREKAGIAKPGAPFVIGEENPDLAAVLVREARETVRGADPAATADIRVVPAGERWDLPLGLRGPHQRRNAAVANAVLGALPPAWRPTSAVIAGAFADARLPGRLQSVGRWLFDVAHNPDGMATLIAALEADPPPGPVHALVSILGDKDWGQMLVSLDTVIDRGVLTMAPTAARRGWDVDWLHHWLSDPARPPARAAWKLVPDFHEALQDVQRDAGTVLVTGSFHTVGDVLSVLGLAPI